MPSSSAERLLGRLGELYEEALRSVEAGDFEHVHRLVQGVDPLLQGLGRVELGGHVERQLHERAVHAHRALLGRLAEEREATLQALRQHRRGSKVLSAYTRGSNSTGARVERDG